MFKYNILSCPWPFFLSSSFYISKSQGVYKTIPNSTSEYFSIFSITVIPLFTCSCKIIGSSPIFFYEAGNFKLYFIIVPMNNKNFFLFTWNNNIIRNIIRNTNCAIIGATRFNNQVLNVYRFFHL